MGQILGLPKIFNIFSSQTEQGKSFMNLIQSLSRRIGDPELCISRDQLRSCLKVVYEVNPWFPDEGTLETKIWKRVKNNVSKASKKGTEIPVEFWITWEIVNSILLFLNNAIDVENIRNNTASAPPTPKSGFHSKNTSEAGEYSSTSSALDGSDAGYESATTYSDSESESDSAERLPDRLGHAPNRPVQAEKKQHPSYRRLRMDSLSHFKKACVSYGPTSPYCREYLADWSKKTYWVPQDFHTVAKTCLSPSQYLEWRMWLYNEAKAKLQGLSHAGQKFSGIELTYEMLTGEGKWRDPERQVTLPRAVFAHVRDAALRAWEKVDADAGFKGSFTKTFQRASEPYADFIGRLMKAIEMQVKDEATQELLTKLLAFENANEDCQAVLLPIKEKEDIFGYLEACWNVGSAKHKVQVYALQRQAQKRCFNCGKPGHFRRDCNAPPNRATRARPGPCPRCKKGNHWARDCRARLAPPGSCPRCKRGNHWARDCRFNFDAVGDPNSGHQQGGQPQAPQNQGMFSVAAPFPSVEFQSSNQYNRCSQ